MAAARVRLVDVFREVAQGRSGGCCGKNCCKLALAPPQLMRLVQRFLPNASPGQLRYLLLLLSTGESGATCGCTGTGGSEAGSAADGKQTKVRALTLWTLRVDASGSCSHTRPTQRWVPGASWARRADHVQGALHSAQGGEQE